jgi:K+-sensing histidine kinase KdpD
MVNSRKDAVVKIDSELLSQVEEFINKKDNKLKYVNKKQFIDLAVFEKLKRG